MGFDHVKYATEAVGKEIVEKYNYKVVELCGVSYHIFTVKECKQVKKISIDIINIIERCDCSYHDGRYKFSKVRDILIENGVSGTYIVTNELYDECDTNFEIRTIKQFELELMKIF